MLSGLSWEQLRLWLVVTSSGTTLWWLNHLKDWVLDCSGPWRLTWHFIICQNGDLESSELLSCLLFQWPLSIQKKLRFRTVGSWSIIQLSFVEGDSMILKLLNHKDIRWQKQQISFLWLLIIPSFRADIVIIMIDFLCYIVILQRESPVVSWDTWLYV